MRSLNSLKINIYFGMSSASTAEDSVADTKGGNEAVITGMREPDYL